MLERRYVTHPFGITFMLPSKPLSVELYQGAIETIPQKDVNIQAIKEHFPVMHAKMNGSHYKLMHSMLEQSIKERVRTKSQMSTLFLKG